MGAVTPLRSVGAEEPRRKRRRGKEEQEEERMGGWIALCVFEWGWLMSVASRGCYPCSGPAGTPLGHLWSHAHTHCSDALCADTHRHSAHKGFYAVQTHCKKYAHTSHTVTADIIINNGGTMGSGATIANTTQRLEVFTVHELSVSDPLLLLLG